MLSKTVHSKISANIDSLKTFLCSSNNYKQQFDVTNCLHFCLKAACDNDSTEQYEVLTLEHHLTDLMQCSCKIWLVLKLSPFSNVRTDLQHWGVKQALQPNSLKQNTFFLDCHIQADTHSALEHSAWQYQEVSVCVKTASDALRVWMGVSCNEMENVSTVKHFWHIHVTKVTMVTFSKQNISGNNGSNNNHRNCGYIGNNQNHHNVSGKSSHNGM